MKYSTVVLDLDGTLTNSEKRVTDRTRQALFRYMEAGGTVVLDEGLWLGEGDITVTGGEIIVPGGEEALSLDNGTVTVTGGTIREP